jgi:hypothetical protein
MLVVSVCGAFFGEYCFVADIQIFPSFGGLPEAGLFGVKSGHV